MNATPESKQKIMEALDQIHFDEEGRSIFEDDYTQDLQGKEDEEPLELGERFSVDMAWRFFLAFLLQMFCLS